MAVTIHTTCCKTHSILCFVRFSQQTAIFPLYDNNGLVVVTEMLYGGSRGGHYSEYGFLAFNAIHCGKSMGIRWVMSSPSSGSRSNPSIKQRDISVYFAAFLANVSILEMEAICSSEFQSLSGLKGITAQKSYSSRCSFFLWGRKRHALQVESRVIRNIDMRASEHSEPHWRPILVERNDKILLQIYSGIWAFSTTRCSQQCVWT
jgi:hypothetical protein